MTSLMVSGAFDISEINHLAGGPVLWFPFDGASLTDITPRELQRFRMAHVEFAEGLYKVEAGELAQSPAPEIGRAADMLASSRRESCCIID